MDRPHPFVYVAQRAISFSIKWNILFTELLNSCTHSTVSEWFYKADKQIRDPDETEKKTKKKKRRRAPFECSCRVDCASA